MAATAIPTTAALIGLNTSAITQPLRPITSKSRGLSIANQAVLTGRCAEI
jgi:hypothetical protein